jgi:linoleoyl-CoA desaturase
MKTPLTKVTFAPSASTRFAAEVKERVAAYFRETGRSPSADTSMVWKTLLLLGITFGSYALILSNLLPPWAMLLLSVVMGVGVAGIGLGIAHDALHGAYSSRGWVNRILGLTFEMMGANGYMWKLTHNVIHHTYPNVHGLDEDLEVSPWLRLSPESQHRPVHRYQHWYAAAAYSMTTLYWVFLKDYKYFLKRDLGPFLERKHPAGEVATLIAGKVLYYAYMLVIPLLVVAVPWWQVLIGFLAMHLTAGIILGVVFQLAHVVEETDHPLPDDEGTMESAWMVHQMETTSNFANGNRLLTWYVGGLNHQVEHHLFPKICSVHYPALAPIVREVAESTGIPYHHHTTLREAIGSHWRTLKRLSTGTA